MKDKISTTISIDTNQEEVWRVLTDPELMVKWMGEEDLKIEVETTWAPNSPVIVRGFHHKKFENKGIVLEFDPEEKLAYTHLSSISKLPDQKESYSVLEFTLKPLEKRTKLTVNIFNFPTLTIRKHLEFYWRGTLTKIKEIAEMSRH